MSMRVGRESGWRHSTASHSGVLSLSERQSLRSAILQVWFKWNGEGCFGVDGEKDSYTYPANVLA
jgi:hypothetical protein